MSDNANIIFIRQRIPECCWSLIDVFTTNDCHNQLAAADLWLLEATASHFGQNRFVWGEFLTDLAHRYPLAKDDSILLVPLFYHLPASAQRLLLSFIYIHRENVPLSALAGFSSTLFAAGSVLPTSSWIKMLLDLLKNFCFMRTKVRSDKRHDSERIDLQCDNIQSSDVLKESCYLFSDQTAKHASAVFKLLKDDVQHYHNGSSLWGPCCQIPARRERQMDVENESDFPDMEMDLSSAEFFDISSMAATQLARADDDVKILSQLYGEDASSVMNTELTDELKVLAERLKDSCKQSVVLSSIDPLFSLTRFELEAWCGAVGFDEMSDSSIFSACQSLCGGSSTSQFSNESSSVLARHMLLVPVQIGRAHV